jgi:heterodisulfide reductase subunit B
LLSLALPAKNLLAASGNTVAVACAACYSRLKTANHRITSDTSARGEVTDALGADYDGSTPVKHLLEIMRDDLGYAAVAKRATKPLKGLRVAAYYGCLLVRPPEVTRFDDPENPRVLDDVLEAVGAETVDWPHKTECCGASYSITNPEIVWLLSREVLAMASEAGADCIATACPLCQLNLDMRQRDIEARYGERFGLPVLYFTQLLGIAFGLAQSDVGLRRLMVDARPLLAEKGLLAESATAAVAR